MNHNEISSKKVSLLVVIYTLEFAIFTFLWIFIFAISEIHITIKLSLIETFYLRFVIYFLQYFYLYIVRYRNGSYVIINMGYKVKYNKKEDNPLFVDTILHYILSIWMMIPYKIYFLSYLILVKWIHNTQLVDIKNYLKSILNDTFSIVQLVYCGFNIILFIIQTVRKSKYVTFAMLLRKIEFVDKKEFK